MDASEAEALELFVKDHDTRFVPKAMSGENGHYLLLKNPNGGEEVTVQSVAEYERDYIRGKDVGPTVREAWGKWRAA
jgi:hypothetical protein